MSEDFTEDRYRTRLLEVFGITDEDLDIFNTSGYREARVQADTETAQFRANIQKWAKQTEANFDMMFLSRECKMHPQYEMDEPPTIDCPDCNFLYDIRGL